MAFTYVLSTDVGKVRLLIPDRDAANVLFQDEEVETFLVLEAANLKRATALALEAIASDEALVQKVIKTLNLETDGAKTSDALLKRARLLRDQAGAADVAADDGAGLFDIAEFAGNPFSERDRLWNEVLRGG